MAIFMAWNVVLNFKDGKYEAKTVEEEIMITVVILLKDLENPCQCVCLQWASRCSLVE